ncbi:hypothetical protein V5799_011629 [Amblyomma americanum]|uniref:Uncharacterized protein n=1 Tax=Amblyomma americanum TaxID=6943 RepID=A0AAQ4EGQ5_AMBAM
MCFDDCRILPSTFLQKPKFDNTNNSSLYDFSLLSAFQYASELKDQFKKSAVAVSVGLQGRWYLMPKNQTEDPVGGPCTTMALQDDNWMFDSAATACLNPAAQKSDDYNCKFVVNKTEGMVFTFDDVDTLRYKCQSHKMERPFRAIVTAAGSWQAVVGQNLRRHLGSLAPHDPYKVSSLDRVAEVLKDSLSAVNSGFSVDIEEHTTPFPR